MPMPVLDDDAECSSRTSSVADINIRLLSRLAETAMTSGDVKTAIDAVRVAAGEVEKLYKLASMDREAAEYDRAVAAAASRSASADRAHAARLMDEATQALAAAEVHRKADHRKRDVPRRLRPAASDVTGYDLRPDLGVATTPAQFMEALRQFRTWAGNPSFRDMAKRCGERPVASTICKLLNKDELPPRFEVVEAVIFGCGGTEDDRQRFATAWRQLVMPEAQPVLRAVPDPA